MLKHWARADAASVPGSAQLRPVASDQYALRHATAPGATTIGVEATRLWLWYSWPNDTVHPAAANDIDFKTRAARGSVCNGLLSSSFVSRSLHLDVIVDIPVPHGWQIRVLKVRVDCTPKIALRGLGATVLEQAVECVQANPHHRSVPLA